MVLSDFNEGENSFRRLTENLPGIVYRVFIEDDNRTIFFNDMVQTMTGYSPEELKRGEVCSIDPLILSEDRLNVINIVKDAIENNVPFEVEYRINNKSGEVKWFSERGRPIRGDNGNPSYIDGVIFDITNRKEAEQKLITSEESLKRLNKELEQRLDEKMIGLRESEKKYKKIFDESPIGIELYDSNGKLVDTNESCLDIFGVSSIDDVAGFELFKDPNIPKEHLKKLKKGQIIRLEILFDFDLIKDLNLYETKKSGKIWIDMLISPLYLEENNTVSNYLVQLQDITKPKIVEQKLIVLNKELDDKVHERTIQLKESEVNYKKLSDEIEMILDHIPALVFYKNTQNQFLRVNKLVADAYNLSKEELAGKSLFDLYPKEVAQTYWDDDLAVIASGKPKLNFEEPWQTTEGKRWVSTSKIPYINEEGDITGIIGFSRDITESKKAEQKIIQEREKANLYLNVVEVILVALDRDGKITLINKKGHELLGYGEGELIGKNWFEVCLPPHDRERVYEYFKKLMAGEIELIKFYENSIWAKTGEERLISWSTVLFKDENGNMTGLLSSGVDITERAIIEQKLIESEEKSRKQNVFLNNILESLTHPFYVINVKDYKVVLANSTASSEGLEHGEYCYSLTHNKDKPCEAPCICPLKEVKNTKKTCVVEHIHYDKEGNEKIYEIYGYPILDENDNVVQMIEYALNITDRKIAQQELKESEKRYRLLFESSPTGIGLSDFEGNVLAMNQKMMEMTGFTLDEFKKTNLRDLYFDINDRIRLLSKLKDVGKVLNYELKLKKKDGTIYDASLNIETLHIGEKKIFLTNQEDITERKKTEQKLRKSEENYRDLAHQWRTTFDAMSECVFLLDLESKILQCNKVTLDFLGKKDYDEIIGHPCLEIIHGTSAPEDRCPMMRMIESNKAETSFAQIGNKWCEITANPVINDEGSLIGAVEIISDITEHKKAEKDLRESEERFRNLIEQSIDGMVMVNEEGKIIEWNKGQEQISGLKKEEVLERFLWDIQIQMIPDENRNLEYYEMLKRMLKEVLKTGDAPWIGELRDVNIQRVDNNENRTIQQLPFLIKTENKIMLGNFSRDVTEQRQIQREIQEKQATLESIFRAAPIGIGMVQNRVFTQLNDRFCKLVGYTPDELLNNSARIIYPSDEEYEHVGKVKYAQIAKFGIGTVETKFQRKDGKFIDVLLSSVPLDSNNFSAGVTFTALDITERKKAEKKLKESEEKLRKQNLFLNNSIESLTHPFYVINVKDYKIVLANSTASSEGLEHGEYCYSLTHNNDKPCEAPCICPLKEVKNTKKSCVVEHIHYDKEGNEKIYEIYGYPILDENGNVVQMIEYTLNITARKKAEQELIESEEKFRTIAERALMGILIIQDNQVKYINDALLNMFEYSQKEIANWEMDDVTKLIHSEDFPFLREHREHLRSSDKSFKPYYSYRVLTKSGKMKWIDQFSKEILYRGRSAELVTIIDISEKKEVEHELIKLNNLKSELLRRTSHELRTPLVSIKGFSDLLLELHRDKLDDYVIRTIEQIRMGCNRLESLVNDILKTAELESGTVELKKSKEDLSLLIKICVSELEGLSELRNHTINLEIPDKLIYSFEKEQIYNVITNILSNAIKFTPYNGKIEVKSEINNDFIIVSIKDNGIGFTEEERSLIFKQFGKIERYGQGYDVISEGSGLGLYISKKIVELHGGEIWLESEGRDKGSTFYFSLPII